MSYGLYFHIPFCKKKCNYCDFLSFSKDGFTEEFIGKYVNSLKAEWDNKKHMIDSADTIFIGGGTPSIINPKYIYDILDCIKKDVSIDQSAEITIEVNPGTVTKEHFEIYKNAGINRISIGVQSTHNRLLKSLGRIHTFDDVVRSVKDAQNAGFENINCDLIFAIPEILSAQAQTISELEQDIKTLLLLNIKHLSAYSLILEEKTKFFDLYNEDKLKFIDDNEERKMYYSLIEILASNGFRHYEISNFALDNYQSRHNIKYWECSKYLGFGIGAASYFPSSKDESYIRQVCTSNISDYACGKFEYDDEKISIEEQMKEYMMLGFRLLSGPDRAGFIKRFGLDYSEYFNEILCNLKNKGLICFDNNAKLTSKGLDFANEVFREFI